MALVAFFCLVKSFDNTIVKTLRKSFFHDFWRDVLNKTTDRNEVKLEI